jgi:flagellar hook-basal body complex protein FliE
VADLTQLESKLGEVMGLAMAAQDAGKKVAKLAKDEGEEDLAETLGRMVDEAKQTQQKAAEVAESFEGKKTAIQREAREAKEKAAEMMSAYLDDDADALDGFEFLTMAEAGELGHVQVLGQMNEKAGNSQVQELVEFVTPIQERHFEETMKGSLKLAAEEDPDEVA